MNGGCGCVCLKKTIVKHHACQTHLFRTLTLMRVYAFSTYNTWEDLNLVCGAYAILLGIERFLMSFRNVSEVSWWSLVLP